MKNLLHTKYRIKNKLNLLSKECVFEESYHSYNRTKGTKLQEPNKDGSLLVQIKHYIKPSFTL